MPPARHAGAIASSLDTHHTHTHTHIRPAIQNARSDSQHHCVHVSTLCSRPTSHTLSVSTRVCNYRMQLSEEAERQLELGELQALMMSTQGPGPPPGAAGGDKHGRGGKGRSGGKGDEDQHEQHEHGGKGGAEGEDGMMAPGAAAVGGRGHVGGGWRTLLRVCATCKEPGGQASGRLGVLVVHA